MSPNKSRCSICGSEFSPQLSYQVEERTEPDPAGGTRLVKQWFCSRSCFDQSLASKDSNRTATCSACHSEFQVELASQVLFLRGRRQYACGQSCRAKLIGLAGNHSLGQRVAAETRAAAEVSVPSSAASSPVTERATHAPAVASCPPAAVEPSSTSDTPPPGEIVPLTSLPRRAAVPVSWRRIDAELSGGPRTLAVFNHKGGTGKTTTAVTLAHGLAMRGKRVLLVDTDGQGNVAVSLGLTMSRSLYHVLVLGQPYAQAVIQARPSLDVLPADETLAAAELFLAGRQQRDQILATRLASAKADYDHIIVDCSPSLSLMNQNALVFADAVLCPVACDYLSLIGVRQVLRTIKQVNRHLNHPVRLWGVLPTLYDSRALVCREALDTLRQNFGSRCLSPVRTTIKVKEAPAQGQSVFEYAPGSNAAMDYEQVVERLTRSESTEQQERAGGAA